MLIIFSSSFDTEIKLFILDHCHECINRGPHARRLSPGKAGWLLSSPPDMHTAKHRGPSHLLGILSIQINEWNRIYKEIIAIFCTYRIFTATFSILWMLYIFLFTDLRMSATYHFLTKHCPTSLLQELMSFPSGAARRVFTVTRWDQGRRCQERRRLG